MLWDNGLPSRCAWDGEGGIPIVDLISTQKTTGKQRELGFFRHKNIEIDSDWWKPMTEEEVDDFIDVRY
jgi:hypothetical protein